MAACQRRLAVGAPTFIPLLGAWIELKQRPHDTETHLGYALTYLGLVVFLAVTTHDVHEMLGRG